MSWLESSIFDLEQIYEYKKENGLVYNLPKEVLESFLEGKAFDYHKGYTPDEKQRLKTDIERIWNHVKASQAHSGGWISLTAGAPGSGKTTLLKQDRELNAQKGFHTAYICPDDVCLRSMEQTYTQDLTQDLKQKKNFYSKKQALENAYNKWRPASNGACHLILARLIKEKKDLYFGTTCSSPHTGKLFELLKEQGYRIRVMHIAAPDNERWDSIAFRDKEFVQSTKQDVIEKGDLVAQRIQDTFLKYADQVDFYYRERFDQDAVLGARWLKNHDKQAMPHLEIIDKKAFEGLRFIQDNVAKCLNRPELLMENNFSWSSSFV